jgi:hypothetical protein
VEVTECLDRLVAFQSIVGTCNRAIVNWIRDYLEELGSRVHILPGPERDRAKWKPAGQPIRSNCASMAAAYTGAAHPT